MSNYAQMSIGRVTSNKEDDYVAVDIRLGDQIVKLKLSMKMYAELMTGKTVHPLIEKNHLKINLGGDK